MYHILQKNFIPVLSQDSRQKVELGDRTLCEETRSTNMATSTQARRSDALADKLCWCEYQKRTKGRLHRVDATLQEY